MIDNSKTIGETAEFLLNVTKKNSSISDISKKNDIFAINTAIEAA